MPISILLNSKDAKMPFRIAAETAGYELYSPYNAYIEPKSSLIINTHICIFSKHGINYFIRGNNELAFEHDIIVFEGTINNNFVDEIKVKLFNMGNQRYKINKYDSIAKLIPVVVHNITFREKKNDNK